MIYTLKKIIGYLQVIALLHSLVSTNVQAADSIRYLQDEDNSDIVWRACTACPLDLSGIYTLLGTCCTGRFTLLEQIEADLTGVLTSLQFTVTTSVDLSDVFTALEACCEGTFTALATITPNFSPVFTAIAPIYEGLCSPQSITQADLDSGTTFTITQPGLYVFAQDLTFAPVIGQPAIAIDANDVTLDMCNKSLTQTNTTLNTFGIDIIGTPSTSPARSNVTVQNGIVKNFTFGVIAGALPGDGPSGPAQLFTLLHVRNINVIGDGVNSFAGIGLFGSSADSTVFPITNSEVVNCTVSNMTSVGIALFVTEDSSIDACIVSNAVSTDKDPFFGIVDFANLKTTIKNCTISDSGTNTAPLANGFIGIVASGSSNCLYDNCTVIDNIAAQPNQCVGIFISGNFAGPVSNVQVNNCIVKHNSCSGSCIGYAVMGGGNTGTILQDCLAESNISTGDECSGFLYDTVTSCNTRRCTALNNLASTTRCSGFNIGGSSGCQGCTWSYCSAVGNTGDSTPNSWGFFPNNSSNANNAYIANTAYRNGPLGTAMTVEQILTSDATPGGVPINSTLPQTAGVTSINDLNDLIMGNQYINVRLADSIGL